MTDIPAADQPATPFAQAVEAVLAEAERHAAWTAELEAELAEARARRARLAQALDGLLRSLEPQEARAWAPRLSALAGPQPERPVGNLAPDGRLAALRRILADWPHETITPQQATHALHAQGLDVPKNYAFNRFRGMVERGALARVGVGRYRILQANPHLVAQAAACEYPI